MASGEAHLDDLFEDYFRSYALAFDAFDAERIASYFHCPCMMVNANAVASFDTREAILRNMEGILRHHEGEGYDHARVGEFRVDRQAENLVTASLRWRVYKSDGSILWDWINSYNLVDYGDGWKILVSTSH